MSSLWFYKQDGCFETVTAGQQSTDNKSALKPCFFPAECMDIASKTSRLSLGGVDFAVYNGRD